MDKFVSSTRLTSLESVIERGKQSFIEVGTALAEIRDNRLYKAEFKTFEAYCRERWGWNSSRARQLIGSAECAKTVTMVTPLNERQARSLSSVPAEHREAVLETVAERGPVTAKAIMEAAEEIETPHIQTAEEEIWEPGGNVKPNPMAYGDVENDSKKLYQLKRQWLNTSKRDRKKFMEWAINH